MPHAKLTLTIPEGIWIGRLTREYPEATVQVLAAMLDGEEGVGLVEVTAPDLEVVLGAMDADDEVAVVDVLQRSENSALVRFETTTPLPLVAARDSGVPLETPFEIRDGELTWEVTAPHEQLSELGDTLDLLGITYNVGYVQEHVPDDQLLTDRQHRMIEAAVESGYYDTPRECSLTELADELDIAKSTASETLHRAEEKIIKRYAAGVAEASPPIR
jgi:predicted DNA binding protein